MVLALLFSAIIWNLGTWYFGIPCSSSHTLIGSIIGVGLAFQLMPEVSMGATVNWSKASDIGLSLLLSPIVGFGLTMLLMMLASKFIKNKEIFEEPDKTKKPPLWIRAILIGTCTGVSYAHGNNDGQKGVGLILVILIALAPLHFALDQSQDIKKIAVDMNDLQVITAKINPASLDSVDAAKFAMVQSSITNSSTLMASANSLEDLSKEQKLKLRSGILKISKDLGKLTKEGKLALTNEDKDLINDNIKDIKKFTDYTPFWVIMLISISLGLGTMIGWKRIVVTLGEKIGKSHLTYAQGASAELVAATTIYTASTFGLPVSTTQILTSAIAGSMSARSGIQNLNPATLKSIGIAWVLTLPVCILLAGGLFFLLSRLA